MNFEKKNVKTQKNVCTLAEIVFERILFVYKQNASDHLFFLARHVQTRFFKYESR